MEKYLNPFIKASIGLRFILGSFQQRSENWKGYGKTPRANAPFKEPEGS